MEDIEIKQTRGPKLRFKGILLAEEEWETRDGYMRIELWQTQGGALIPVTDGPMHGGRDVRAAVIEPDGNEPDFEMATGDSRTDGQRLIIAPSDQMRFAVMDFFDWNNRARSMVGKKLKWSLVREIA